uniref:Ig-like domain-containing protein n=1 Tax=Oreochromis niloticus TaxID=8128 RepID=A0A669F4A8_ORENI
ISPIIILKRILTCCGLLLIDVSSAGSSLSDQVNQDPANIYTRGEDAKIYCSQSIPNYNRILWYKQLETQLQFLGYMYLNDDNPEPGVNVMINGSARTGEKCTLTIKDIKPSSSGVYFCAASFHSAANHSTSIQKPNNTSFSCFHYYCDL